MTQPNIFVVDGLVSLVKSNFNEANVAGDKQILIDEADELGKGRDLGVYDYIEFSGTSPNSIEYADLTMSSQDVDAATFVELKADGKTRRKEMFDELRSIIEANRKRPDTPGNFDRMIFGDVTNLDDETFGAYVLEFPILFEARSRSVV